ncbi:MAG: hypothetical protein SGJ02_02300, partial [bacterium]|nr:hypothetical protein [bacterium]
MTTKIFDSHFHLLFKHHVSVKEKDKPFNLDEEVKTKSFGKLANDLFGGPFDSQSSPSQVAKSNLYLGITSILSMEHAFANQILRRGGIDMSHILPLDFEMVERTKNGKTTYYKEFNLQLDFHIKNKKFLINKYNIYFLNRTDALGDKSEEDIKNYLKKGDNHYFVLSIEGGHNLSTSPVHIASELPIHPEKQLKEIQDRDDCDFISLNLCHLSHIPEQYLGGFAQGHNGLAMLAFKSNDFHPIHN